MTVKNKNLPTAPSNVRHMTRKLHLNAKLQELKGNLQMLLSMHFIGFSDWINLDKNVAFSLENLNHDLDHKSDKFWRLWKPFHTSLVSGGQSLIVLFGCAIYLFIFCHTPEQFMHLFCTHSCFVFILQRLFLVCGDFSKVYIYIFIFLLLMLKSACAFKDAAGWFVSSLWHFELL